MSVESIYLPHLGRQFKFGRRRPIARPLSFSMRRYLTGALPVPPAQTDYSKAAASLLSNYYLNDQLGDCVITAGYQVVGTLTGNAGNLSSATQGQIIADYSEIGAYDPYATPVAGPGGQLVNPTDNGCNDQDALNYWTQTGFQDGAKLLG